MVGTTLSRRRFLAFGGTAALTGLAGCNDPLSTIGEDDEEDDDDGRNGAPESSPAPESATESPYAAVYERAVDSVVFVESAQGQGTGFVFDDDFLVTNAHVVGGSSTVDVRFTGSQWRTGDVVGVDPHSDLAAIAIDDVPSAATPLPFVEDEPTVGQEVVAIGNPYNLDGTVTTGIVSGINRSIPAPTGYQIPDAIQTDAAVNPGNSGGPLMSLGGRVLAVINSGGGDNIAFGISAALTRRVVPRLVETGSFDHAYAGVSFADVTPEMARANDLDQPRGLLVIDVANGGPADGVLRPSDGATVVDGRQVYVGGDVVLAIDGTTVTTAEAFGSYLALRTRPGDTVELTVLREGTERTVDLELGTRPS